MVSFTFSAGYGTPSGPAGYQGWGAPAGPQGQGMAPQWGSNYGGPPQQQGYSSYGKLMSLTCSDIHSCMVVLPFLVL